MCESFLNHFSKALQLDERKKADYRHYENVLGFSDIISRLSEFCVGHFMTYYIPVGLINRHFVSYYMMYCAGPRAR